MSTTDQARPASEPVEYEFPVSPVQGRLLVLDLMNPGTAQYHVPVAFTVRGPLDLNAFTAALDTLVDRHESLRTTFRHSGRDYVQVIADQARADVTVLRDVSPDGLVAVMTTEAARPFDLGRGPLLRAVIYCVTDGSYRILLTAHHLVCDGWSLQLLLTELASCYRAASAGLPAALEPLPIQYPDYAAWQHERLASGGYAEAVAHWADVLRGAPATLELPIRQARPAVQSTDGGTEAFVLPAATWQRLAQLARGCGTTAFAATFAAFNVFLHRISGQTDLVVGIPESGRDRPDLQGMIGMLANTLALRTDLDGDPTFTEVLRRVVAMLNQTRPFSAAPFNAVVDAVAPQRELSHDPVVQVVFAYDDDATVALDLAGASVDRAELAIPSVKFDLLMFVERVGEDLGAQFVYRSDLFDQATIQHWVRSFTVLLDGLLADPERPISAVGMLGAADRDTIVHSWNNVVAEVPGRLVPDLIAERVARQPDAVALVCGDAVVSYRELLTRADALAVELRGAGVGPEVPVGICVHRSVDMAIAALAVLRAGGAYIPVDPEQPPARLTYMLSDAGSRLVLASPSTADRATSAGVPVAVLAEGATGFATPVPRIGARPSGEPGLRNAAYLLFTSGSTGRPKGVVIQHSSLTNLVFAAQAVFRLVATDRVLQYVSFGFDVSVSDLFVTWMAGASLHIAAEHERLGAALLARLEDSRITISLLTPSSAMSLPWSPGALPRVRNLTVGGESSPQELVDRWATAGRRVINAYGPSEATVFSTLGDMPPGKPVMVGTPMANTQVYVLDRWLRPVPVGVPGEVYLGGASLGRGYTARPALTAERFVASPFGPPGSLLYRSGDLGSHDAEGLLYYHGRADTQVKVRGFRVELGEIETVLATHPAVGAAAATAWGSGGDRRLAAYVVPDGDARPDTGELRVWLSSRLPGYMVPEVIVTVTELPVNRSGKLERSRLPQPPTVRPDLGRPYVEPGTPTQRRLAAIWAQVLGLDRIGIHDNFFDLGGNSLRMLGVLTALTEPSAAAGQPPGVSFVDLFRHPTIAALAAYLDEPAAPPPDHTAAGARGRDRRDRLAARLAASRNANHVEKGDTP